MKEKGEGEPPINAEKSGAHSEDTIESLFIAKGRRPETQRAQRPTEAVCHRGHRGHREIPLFLISEFSVANGSSFLNKIKEKVM